MQFFYNDLSRKTNDRLDAFDRDFGKRLQEEHRRQKKVYYCYDQLIQSN